MTDTTTTPNKALQPKPGSVVSSAFADGVTGPAWLSCCPQTTPHTMLRAAYQSAQRELLVDGRREDYAHLSETTRQAIDSGVEAELTVQSTGATAITHFVVRRGTPPNRVSVEGSRVVFSVSPGLQRQFLSFIEFPADADLPDTPIQYHHHFDGLADDGYVAADSLPVVFALERV